MHRSDSTARWSLWLAVVAATACQDPAPVRAVGADLHSHAAAVRAEPVSGDVQRQIAKLRALTAPFHRFEAATAAGWTEPIPGCFANPELGGMGFHYGNPAYMDGTVNELEPELLVYEPQKNGKLRLVAVEYIVDLDEWTSSEPPRLFGVSFAKNDAFGIWALHVWHERHNPRGTFADWNPKVTCAHAP